jgi:hypothetical protein
MGSDSAARQGMLNSLEKFSDQAKEATLLAGGIKPLTAWFEGATAAGLVTKVLKVAHGGKISKSFETTLKEMGLTGKLRKQVLSEMKKHTSYDDSMFGVKLKKINVENWDPEVSQKFIMGVKRLTNTIVQRTTLGDKLGIRLGGGDSLIQNTWAGKFALEMKGYIITAWSKQLGRALTRRDLHSVGLLSTQMAFGAIAYMAQVHVNYAGRPDKRAELLTIDNIAKATFARSSMASFIPTLIDTGAAVTKAYKPQFSHSRSSGLASDIIGGLPAVDLLNSAINLGTLPAAALGYGDITQGQLRQALKIAPFFNIIGVRSGAEWLTQVYGEGRDTSKGSRFSY